MTSIIIAGKPNSEEMSQCILLAENIHNLYPSTRFTIVLKHENEWETYSKDLCNLFALQTQTHPLILFSNGKQIGDTQQFFKLISDSFKNEMIFFDEKTESYTLRFDPLSIANLTQENTTLINKEYTRRTKDLFITDKILNALDRIEISKYGNEYGKYNTITTDYDVEYLKDLKVFVKYHEKYTPNEDEYKEEEDLIVFGKVVVSREEYMKFKEEVERKKKELEQMNNPIQQVDEGNDNEQGDTSEHKDEQQDNANAVGDNKDEDKHDKKKKGTVNKGKEENNTATNNDVVAVMQSQSIEGIKEGEDVPERKELKFGYYRDLDIPIKTYEEDILVQKYDEEGFELILNPAFTFLGETLINKPLDDTPVKLEKPIEENKQQQEAQQEGEDEVKEGNDGEVKDDANEEDKNNEEANNNGDDNGNEGANKEHETNEQQVNANDVQDQQQQQQQSQLVQSQIQGEPSVHDDQQQQQPNEPEEEKIEYPHDPNLPTNSDPNSKNAEHPDKILIKDYGKMPSLRKMVYEDEEYPLYEDAIPLYQLEHNIHNRTNLHNIESFVLNEKDLTTMIQMIQETEGYATLRILPYKYADWKEFGSSKIKIIPKKPTDLKGDVFPIELKIEQQLKKIRRDILIQKQMQLQQEEERKSTKNEGGDVNEQSQIRFTSSDVKGEDNDEEEAEGEAEADNNEEEANNNVDTANNNNDDNKSKASVSSKSSAKSNPKSSAKSITSRSKQSVKSAKSDKSFKSEKSVAKSEKSVKSAVAKSEKSAIAKSTKSVAKSVAKSKTASKIEKSFMTNPQYTDNFAMPSLFTLDVYDSENIKHCIKHFPLGQFNLANVKEGIQSMLETLEINNSNGNGLILICSDTFLLMAPLTEPFTYTKKQLVPMFAEPHFFMGVFTLPFIESEWPDSIKRKTVVFDFADILRKSTN